MIPLIDIAPFRDGDRRAHREVAEAVGRACEEIGFFLVTGHGVHEELVARMHRVCMGFFGLPLCERQACAPADRGSPRGYRGVMDANLAYSFDKEAPPDLQEGFTIGSVDTDSIFGPNVWPVRPAEFRVTWVEYWRAMERLAATIMRIFAIALDLDEQFFEPRIDRHASALRALHYPEQVSPPVPGQLRAGEHSDFGSLTILYQEDKPGGLQVRTRKGSWIDARPVPASFTVNIGDLMQMWTNDRWVSTVHRVSNPPPGVGRESRRLSVAFFHQPNDDAVISCIESCVGPDRPAKYPAITSGEHMWRKIRKSLGALDTHTSS